MANTIHSSLLAPLFLMTMIALYAFAWAYFDARSVDACAQARLMQDFGGKDASEACR